MLSSLGPTQVFSQTPLAATALWPRAYSTRLNPTSLLRPALAWVVHTNGQYNGMAYSKQRMCVD